MDSEPRIGGKIQEVVKQSGFDTSSQGYQTELSFYGGKIKQDPNGKYVYDSRGVINTIDKQGDRRLRSADEQIINTDLAREHRRRFWRRKLNKLLERTHIKSPSEEQKRMNETWEANKPKWEGKERRVNSVASKSPARLALEGFVLGKSMRHRHIGTAEEIRENVSRLGLEEYYGPHAWGIEFKKPEIFTQGVSLYDVVVAKKEGKEPLEDVDQQQAFAEAGKYIRQVHDEHGGIGELLIMDIQFQKKEGSKLSDPVLGLPDIVWDKDATLSETAKKATDVMDFLVNTAFWQRRAGMQPADITHVLNTFIKSYGDLKVIQAVRAFVNPDRGSRRLTMAGETGHGGIARKLSEMHNAARLGVIPEETKNVRQEVFDVVNNYVQTHKFKSQPPAQ